MQPLLRLTVERIGRDSEGVPAPGFLTQPGLLARLAQLRQVGDLVLVGRADGGMIRLYR